jgi:triosephosphate isomerase
MSKAATTLRPLVAGNWKMNGLRSMLGEAGRVAEALGRPALSNVDAMICPPATLLAALASETKGTRLAIGGQDCHIAASGPHTGDVSAEMMKDAGATAVIVGHSERRADHGETDAIVGQKASAAVRAGLAAIICVGETAGQRRAGLTLEVVGRQMKGSVPYDIGPDALVIAYEPVWAIGTGLTPAAADIAAVHGFMRGLLVERLGDRGRAIRLLYGGSVKPSNATEILGIDHVNGALVGGASLKADDFLGILAAYAI